MSVPKDFVIKDSVLTKYKGPGGDVVIPDNVTSIGRSAFEGCSSLTGVSIPEGVTSIGWIAFSGCSSLTNVSIPDSVTEIGLRAFSGCSSLTSVSIPDSVTSIGGDAFEGCSSLTGVSIPEGVTSINYGTFQNCSSLVSVTIPEGVTSIDKDAFSGCSSLTSVTIPDSVTEIGFRAFKDTALYYDRSRWENGVLYLGDHLIKADDSIKGDYTVRPGTRCIGNGAFSGCSSLTGVSIPESVTNIGNEAFENCSSLTSVSISDGVIRIGWDTFSGCSNLTGVSIPDSVTKIGLRAFSGCSSLTSVSIPDSVTSIDMEAFKGCSSLTSVSIPDRVTSIDTEAFNGCSSLISVSIPDSVTGIGDRAFSGCTSLTNVSIPDSVTEIGFRAFKDTALFSDRNRWENGVLYLGDHLIKAEDSIKGDYTVRQGTRCIGNGAFYNCGSLTGVTIPDSMTDIGGSAFSGCSSLISVSIPDSVTGIGEYAFSGCSSLTSVTIPESVTSIGGNAFEGCSSLTNVMIPESVTSIGSGALKDCSKLQWVKGPLLPKLPCYPIASGCSFPLLLYGNQPVWLAYSAKSSQDNLTDFAKPGKWAQYDLELINNGPEYKYKLPARLLGALGRLADPVELTEENRALLAELVVKNAKKLVPLAEETGEAKLIEALFSLNVLDNKTVKAMKKVLEASPVPEIAALAEAELKTAGSAPAAAKTKTPQSPLQKEYAEKLKAIKGDAAIKKMKLLGNAMPAVKLADGTEAPEELFRYLLASYGSQLDGVYRFVPEADETAKLLAYDSLCAAMDEVSGHLDGPSYPAVLPLLCRFGNAKQIRALTKAWKDWDDWYKYGQKGRRAQEILPETLVLSDTREAVIWLEKNRSLKKYAALRGATEAEIYEKCLFDFGFDENGRRVFDLGSTSIEVTLTPELGLSMLDTANGKSVKSIPKKGVDPALQKKAADELADIQQSLKKAAKIKTAQLFEDYLDAASLPAERWKRSYLGNPFLRTVASLLVWTQGGTCFVLTASGPVDSRGQPYALTDAPITIAHPMEMEPGEVKAWQKYFTSHGLKQPFAQVWEPAFDPETVREDRYRDCRINPLYLKNQQKRGIDADWYRSEDQGGRYIRIEGFRVLATDAERRDGDEREYLEIFRIRPEVWNRRANMVIAFLDRITMWDRVKKDDVSVVNLMGSFTLAQITEFVKTAQEANAVNVLALLLDYKNTHFADFDPMEEFTLEW